MIVESKLKDEGFTVKKTFSYVSVDGDDYNGTQSISTKYIVSWY